MSETQSSRLFGLVYLLVTSICLPPNTAAVIKLVLHTNVKLPIVQSTGLLRNVRLCTHFITWKQREKYKNQILFFSLEIQPCPASLQTIKDDFRCPRNNLEWNKKAEEMKCASFSQNYTETSNFVYHCLVNVWGNGTIHVCAPTRVIFGNLRVHSTSSQYFVGLV